MHPPVALFWSDRVGRVRSEYRGRVGNIRGLRHGYAECFHAAVEQFDLPRDSLPLSRDEQASETHLLLSSLDLALSFIATAHRCNDRERAARLLTQAVESYGSVKGLLPKLELRPEQVALVSGRLKAVQQCLHRMTAASVEGP